MSIRIVRLTLIVMLISVNISCNSQEQTQKSVVGFRIDPSAYGDFGRLKFDANGKLVIDDECENLFYVKIEGYLDVDFSFDESAKCVLMQRDKNFEVREVAKGILSRKDGQILFFRLCPTNKIFSRKDVGLLQVELKDTSLYKGLLYEISKNAVKLDASFGEYMTSKRFVFFQNDIRSEMAVIDSLFNTCNTEIKSMLLEHDKSKTSRSNNWFPEDFIIKEGKFRGKSYIETLRTISKEHIIEFLKYIAVTPKYYFAKNYNFKSIFLYWVSGTTEKFVFNN